MNPAWQLGGDPRAVPAFAGLRRELAKLDHPARPDVDWAQVEQCCAALLRGNGAELHTVAAWVLAQAHRQGIPGALAAITLLNRWLTEQWSRLWPLATAERLALLDGLFSHLQPWLRHARAGSPSVASLAQLGAELRHLDEWLRQRLHTVLPALGALRHTLEQATQALERTAAHSPDAPVLYGFVPAPAQAAFAGAQPAPVMLWMGTPPPPPTRWLRWAAGLLLAAGLAAGLAWVWRGSQETPAVTPVRLGSLPLFAAGGTTFTGQAPAVLVEALLAIQARPGWQVVIEGHSDASGDSAANLRLSIARAHAVRDWLQASAGLPAACLTAVGHGADRPLASNDTPAGRAANRRVDIQLVPRQPGCS